jgi:hypothetical protein
VQPDEGFTVHQTAEHLPRVDARRGNHAKARHGYAVGGGHGSGLLGFLGFDDELVDDADKFADVLRRTHIPFKTTLYFSSHSKISSTSIRESIWSSSRVASGWILAGRFQNDRRGMHG